MTEIERVSLGVELNATPAITVLKEMEGLSNRFGSSITRSLKSAIRGGKDFESTLKSIALSLSDVALNSALQPLKSTLSNSIGGLLSGLAGSFTLPAITPFAQGGVLTSPTFFPLAGQLGLAGEAGAEAILPLQRGADGRLGVASGGGQSGMSVNITINTPDANSFRQSESQVSASLARAVARAQRNG